MNQLSWTISLLEAMRMLHVAILMFIPACILVGRLNVPILISRSDFYDGIWHELDLIICGDVFGHNSPLFMHELVTMLLYDTKCGMVRFDWTICTLVSVCGVQNFPLTKWHQKRVRARLLVPAAEGLMSTVFATHYMLFASRTSSPEPSTLTGALI